MVTRRGTISLVLLVAVAAACGGGGGGGDDAGPAPATDTFASCDGADPTGDGGGCLPPGATCAAGDPSGVAGACAAEHRACVAGAAGASCGACLAGFRDVAGACEAVRTCDDLDCATANRACVPAGAHRDATCGACLDDAIDDGGTCATPNCEPAGTPGSLGAACEAVRRTCVVGPSGAGCGVCLRGYADGGGACVPVRTCAALGCVEAHRPCTPAGDHEDAACGDCAPGFVAVEGACRPDPDATCAPGGAHGIADACAQASRACVATAEGAACGACGDGTVENGETGLCEPPMTCATLDCGADHRVCEEEPNGHCTGCLDGFVEDPDTGRCRATLSCADLTCDETEECAEATSSTDAFCRPDCGPDALWSGRRCEPCPPCDGPGEVRRWPAPAASGACVCETAPGYFYTLSANVGAAPCDADGDGWTRESARTALESTDPVLRANARCDLRTIDRFELRNEAGQRHEVALSQPLALYETDRNDDDRLLAAAWDARSFPDYGRRPRAAELNRLTKICHHLQMDYNDNAVADVVEYAAHPLGSTMRPDQAPFNQMAYFVELHRGWYEPVPGSDDGRYVIEEKSRRDDPALPATERVPLVYAPDDGDHWRVCEVQRDAEWEELKPPIGVDFARYETDEDAPGWTGMHHHSQFKCLIANPAPSGAVPTEISQDDMFAYGYRLSRCGAAADPVVGTDNPASMPIACRSVSAEDLAAGDVAWGGVPYLPHGGLTGRPYVRGCVNECIAQLPLCPGYDADPLAVDCAIDENDFGRFDRCTVREVCNNIDDNEDGVVDNDPVRGRYGDEVVLMGADCDTGQAGACNAGRFVCSVPPGVEDVCTPDDDLDGLRSCLATCAHTGTVAVPIPFGATVFVPVTATAEQCLQMDFIQACAGQCVAAWPGCLRPFSALSYVCRGCLERVGLHQPQIALDACMPPADAGEHETWCQRRLDPTPEVCDGDDDDCDGVDDNEPTTGSGRTCTLEGLKGECARGRTRCEAAEIVCEQVRQPGEELAEGCNQRDDDCDGFTDNLPLGQDCVEPWLKYYPDGDGDGYGDGGPGSLGECLCPYQAAARVAAGEPLVANNDDCCDIDRRANPDNRTFYASANECSGYDWDCDGEVQYQYPTAGAGPGCGICAGCGCHPGSGSWVSSVVPFCGQAADFYKGGTTGCNAVCGQKRDTVTQRCR